MIKLSVILMSLAVVLASGQVYAGKPVLSCIRQNPDGSEGYRINIIISTKPAGQLKATLSEGTTMNTFGTYWVAKTSYGYAGTDREHGWPLILFVGKTPAQNKFIEGVAAEVKKLVHVNLPDPKGYTSVSDLSIVCGTRR